MASRFACAVAVLQVASVSGAQLAQLRGASHEVQQSSWLESSLPILATLPYYEGKLISLARRLDLSVLFPDQKAQTLAGLTPELEEAGKKMDKAGKQFADEFQPDTVKAKGDKLAKDLHPETVGKNLERDLHPDKLRPDALAKDIPQRIGEHHPVLDKDGKPKDDTTVLAAVVSTASSMVVWLLLATCAAIFYRFSKDVSEVDLEQVGGTFKDKGFAHGPFDCFEDIDTCCWSFWCGGVQWADTMGAVGTMSFWLAFTLFVVIAFLNTLVGVLLWLPAALLFAYFRQDLRRKFGLQNETSDMAKDVAMWCCCWCCAIAQEARHVKAARKADAAS